MYDGRILVQATVTAVISNRPVYPCCRQCYHKLLCDFHSTSWLCKACRIVHQSDNVSWRYCLSLRIADCASACDVSVFGKTLEPFFGVTADKFHSIMVNLENEDSVEVVSKSLDKAFLGHSFLFGFKSHVSTERLKKSTSSPITLAQIMNGGKLLQSRRRYQDRNNLTAVLMLSPSSESFPTVAYNIYMSHNSLKPLNVSPCGNGSPTKEDEIVTSQISIKTSITNENTHAGSETGLFSDDSFGQSTLQFSCEDPYSQTDKMPDLPKSASEIFETKSAECISSSTPKSTLVLKQDDKDHHRIQRTRSELCHYMKDSSFNTNKTLPGFLTNSLLPQCPSPRTKTVTAGCIRNGREKLRKLEIKTLCDSSDLSGSSEGELSERRKEKRSCSLPKLTESKNTNKISQEYTPKAENNFSCNDIVDDPKVLEQLFDDSESWLQIKDSQTDSKIHEHSDMPESENINEVLDNVLKDENSFEHGHCSNSDKHKHDTSSQRKDDQGLKDTFSESVRIDLPDSEDLSESEDIDAFLKKSSNNCQSKNRVFPTLARTSQTLQNSQIYNTDSPVSTEICSRKVLHQKPSQRKVNYNSGDSKGQANQDTAPLKNTEDRLFDKIHTSINDSENMANISNKYSEFNTENNVSNDLGKDCNTVTNKSDIPNRARVREQKKFKKRTLCKSYQEKFIEKYSDKLSAPSCNDPNIPSKAKPVLASLKCSGLPVKSKSLDRSHKRESLRNLISEIERKTQILDLLKADCEMKRVEVLLDLKCKSLENNTECMMEKSDNVINVSEIKPFLHSSTKQLQSSAEKKLDDKPKALFAHHSKNKTKKTSDMKVDSPYGKVEINATNRGRGKIISSIKGNRCKRSTNTEPCTSASLESGVYFNSQKITLHKRTNQKYYQYLPGNLSKSASLDFNTMATTDHNATEAFSIDIPGLSNSEADVPLQENMSANHMCTMDARSPKDLREDYSSNCNTNRSNNEESDSENCFAKIDMLIEDNINSEPLYSDCDESVLKSGKFRKRLMQNKDLCTDHTQNRKASGLNNANFSIHYDGSLDLFDTSEPGKSISDNNASSSTPTKSLTNCTVDSLHVPGTSKCSTDELNTPGTDKTNNSNSTSKSVCVDDETGAAADTFKRNTGERDECQNTPLSSKSKHVQFSKRLSRISTISVIDKLMATSSPVCDAQKTPSLKSCLKKSVTEISADCANPFSQDLFSPSPIFNNNSLKRHKKDSAEYDELKTALSYDSNNPESVNTKYANGNNNNSMVGSSFGIEEYFSQYEIVDSPLLFSAKKLGLSAPKHAKRFVNMCEDKAASPRSGSLQNKSFLPLTPDLFSP